MREFVNPRNDFFMKILTVTAFCAHARKDDLASFRPKIAAHPA